MTTKVNKKTPQRDLVDSLINSRVTENEAYIEEDASLIKESAPSEYVSRMQNKSNARKIVPNYTIKVPRKSPIPEGLRAERDHGWEYVDGIFENRFAPGEPITFCKNPFPGDGYSEWTIPANIPISIPRWLAKHLNDRKWKQFGFKDRESSRLIPGDVMQNFDVTGIQHRTSFMRVSEY